MAASPVSTGPTVIDATDTNAITRVSAEIAARYPANTIDSVARATSALADVARARVQVKTQLARDERACTPAFFTTRCLEQARERHRTALARLQPIEIEANTTKRRARLDERERAQAQKPVKAEPAAKPRGAKLPESALPSDPRDGQARQSAAGAADMPGASRTGASETASAVPRTRAPAVTQAASRSRPAQVRSAAPAISRAAEEANMAAFDRKAAESAKRQREIAAKKVEKEQDRARKKAAVVVPAAALPPAH